MTIELGDFPRRRPTIARLDLRPLAQLAPALWAPRAASRPRTTPFASLDLDAFQFDVLLGVSVVKSNVVGAIRPDTCHFSGIELALSFKICLYLVALAGLLRRAPVILGVRVQGLDELFLDARLVLAIVIADVVGPIAPITANLARVELRAAA